MLTLSNPRSLRLGVLSAGARPIRDENGPAAGRNPGRRAACQVSSAVEPRSGRGDMPDVVAAIAEDVAGLLVVLPEIQRLALVGPLLAAVVTDDHRPGAGGLGIRRSHQRRPVGRALGVAGRLAGRGVAVEDVERYALGVDHGLALG